MVKKIIDQELVKLFYGTDLDEFENTLRVQFNNLSSKKRAKLDEAIFVIFRNGFIEGMKYQMDKVNDLGECLRKIDSEKKTEE